MKEILRWVFRILALVFLVAFLGWSLVDKLFMDNVAIPEDSQQGLAIGLQATRQKVIEWTADKSPRLVPYYGRSLDVYISKDDFERIPFPNRKKMVSEVSIAWSRNISWPFLFALIEIRDIKTGKILASSNSSGAPVWLYDVEKTPIHIHL